MIDAATAVELLHLASLYHDDVLDSARVRRGRPSANALWGNHAAVLGGDVLLAHAYRVAADLGAPELRRFAHTLAALCSGQIAESAAQFDPARDVAHYDASIRGKTAALLATSCWLGASTAGASPQAADALACFGMELGVAFQIVDDVLDLYGHGLQTGKPAGSDLREGVFTLPVLMALQRDPTLVELLVEGIDDAGVAEVAAACVPSAPTGARSPSHWTIWRCAFAHLGDSAFLPDGVRLLLTIGELVLEPLERLGFGSRTSPLAPAGRPAATGRGAGRMTIAAEPVIELLPFHCPFPTAVHPQAGEIERHCVAWIDRFELYGSAAQRERLVGTRAAEIYARALPTADAERVADVGEVALLGLRDRRPLLRQRSRQQARRRLPRARRAARAPVRGAARRLRRASCPTTTRCATSRTRSCATRRRHSGSSGRTPRARGSSGWRGTSPTPSAACRRRSTTTSRCACTPAGSRAGRRRSTSRTGSS